MKAKFTTAFQLQRDVKETQLDDPFHVHIVFVDQSEMIFRAVLGSTEPQIKGEPDSVAVSMGRQITNYTYLAAGVMMKFRDGSSCPMNFGRKIAASSVAPLAPALAKLTFA